jgi:hypothetical protein
MIPFDPDQFIFAPIRAVYTFHLTLTTKFKETLGLTDAEVSFLEPRIPIGRLFPSVSIRLEDWRSHLVLNVEEPGPYSLGEHWEGKRAIKHEGDEFAYERRERKETVYAHDFDRYGKLDLWRRFLSEAREEYISPGVEDTWTMYLGAIGGRFGQSVLPDRIRTDENTYLELRITEGDLRSYSFIETEDGEDDPDWRKKYRNEQSNGVSWELCVVDVQKYLELRCS